MLLLRYPLHTALTVSASLAQIGEFSFILAALGVSLGLLPARGAEPDPGRRADLDRASIRCVFSAIEPLQRWLLRALGTARASWTRATTRWPNCR